MPLILIIVGVIAALILGFIYTQSQSEGEIEIEAPSIRVEETAPTPEVPAAETPTDSAVTSAPAPVAATADTAFTYTDGTYDATANYVTPGRSSHDVNVTLTVADDTITNASVTFTGDDNRTSTGWQSKFAAAYQTQVVGKKIDDVSLTRVGGASLTTGAFNKALAEVKASAQS